jgi:hypothetical protein
LALMEIYIEGVSTRKVKEVTEELCGTSFSKSLLSSLAGSLDSELSAWRNRPLEAKAYPYVFVDACYEKVREVVSQGVLIVSAVRNDGFRQICGVEVADTESEATYPRTLPLAQGPQAQRRPARRQRRPRRAKGGHRAPLPRSLLATLPSSLRQEPPRYGGP